jgi:hypothetical protein
MYMNTNKYAEKTHLEVKLTTHEALTPNTTTLRLLSTHWLEISPTQEYHETTTLSSNVENKNA